MFQSQSWRLQKLTSHSLIFPVCRWKCESTFLALTFSPPLWDRKSNLAEGSHKHLLFRIYAVTIPFRDLSRSPSCANCTRCFHLQHTSQSNHQRKQLVKNNKKSSKMVSCPDLHDSLKGGEFSPWGHTTLHIPSTQASIDLHNEPSA